MSVITPNTDFILLKSKIELDNRNQLTFPNVTSQYNYFYNLPKLVADGFTYQRQDETVRFPATRDDIIEYNYCMYRNSSYGNKWFYAFITDMKYISNEVTAISIKTDCFQTWQFDLAFKNSFVEREHVNSDGIGEHTVPEGLETGEYVNNGTESVLFDDLVYILQASEQPDGNKGTLATSVNGIWQMGNFYAFDNIASLVTVITAYTKPDAIKNVYIVPKYLLNTSSFNTKWGGNTTPIFTSKTINKIGTLNSYDPVNNKLLCYPYSYLLETNNNGASNVFKYELFPGNSCTFSIGGCATVGGSIISIPTSYSEGDETNMLTAGKFPTCSWSEDAYTNWLTMNGVNIMGIELNAEQKGYIGGAVMSGIGIKELLSGNPFGLSSLNEGLGMIIDTMRESYTHKLIPDSYKGNINGGDFLTASGKNGFYFYKMSIKAEMARKIDKYFSMFGYKINETKIPNLTGRTNWNYVKTIGANIEGYLPQKALEEIKQLFNNGITLWHNPNTFLDYSQTNTIIT